MSEIGTVKWFSNEKGFGFITTEDGTAVNTTVKPEGEPLPEPVVEVIPEGGAVEDEAPAEEEAPADETPADETPLGDGADIAINYRRDADAAAALAGAAPFSRLMLLKTVGLPESHLDMPVDFDSLTAAGSMMGSGGMIVMDDSTCMVWMAKNLIYFYKHESCGKCSPCREGTGWMLRLLERIEAGERRHDDRRPR